MDAGYLKHQIGVPLGKCLAEVSEKRPYDPIEYIAHWLYKYIANQKFEQQKAAEAAQLIQEQKDYELELERQERVRQEAERFAEIEAERKKAEEEQRAREALAAKMAEEAEREKLAAEMPPAETAGEDEQPGENVDTTEGGEAPVEEGGEAPQTGEDMLAEEGEAAEEITSLMDP